MKVIQTMICHHLQTEKSDPTSSQAAAIKKQLLQCGNCMVAKATQLGSQWWTTELLRYWEQLTSKVGAITDASVRMPSILHESFGRSVRHWLMLLSNLQIEQMRKCCCVSKQPSTWSLQKRRFSAFWTQAPNITASCTKTTNCVGNNTLTNECNVTLTVFDTLANTLDYYMECLQALNLLA